MMLLKNVDDVEALISAVGQCDGDVILRNVDGSEEFNLKSKLSQYIAIGELCRDHGDEWEVFCMNRADEGHMLNFFCKLNKEADVND